MTEDQKNTNNQEQDQADQEQSQQKVDLADEEVDSQNIEKAEDEQRIQDVAPGSTKEIESSEEVASSEDEEKKSTEDMISDIRKDAAEEFDWDEYEKAVRGGDEEKSESEQLYDETLSTINEKEIVEGTVVSISKREVVINIGYKSEGVVSLNEFRYNPDLKVGDKVDVYIENKEDKNGQLVLSHKKARTLKAWEKINEVYDKGEVVKGYIKSRTKGGMIVDLYGIETFLPGSQIDVKPIRDYDAYVGKTMDFKVVKINYEFKNVVVSHKVLIEAELEQQKKEIISKLEKGQVLEGTVKNITSYGVFMDLGGVDGLIHITDLSWGRINHPEEIVQLDQKLNVVVLDFDENKSRIALGLKQLSPHPWESLDPNLKVGDVVMAKVVVLADYGAFVEIKPGVEGLIHVSEMSWSQQLRSAQEFLQIGDEVEAKILTLDREERKMALSLKQLKPDPWDQIEEKYPVDTKTTATVRNFTNFGVFVEIEEGIDGLIHISDLSWTKKINHPAEFTSLGEQMEVVVLEVNKENRRLRLGHKQLEENPWDVFETVFTENSVHEGTVLEYIDNKGAKIALPYGVEGFASIKHLVKEDGQHPKQEEKLPFKVIEFSKEDRRIILSHTRVYKDEEKNKEEQAKKEEQENVKKTQKSLKDNMEKTTLGDVAGGLESVKTAMNTSDQTSSTPEQEETTESSPEASADSNEAQSSASSGEEGKSEEDHDSEEKEDQSGQSSDEEDENENQ